MLDQGNHISKLPWILCWTLALSVLSLANAQSSGSTTSPATTAISLNGRWQPPEPAPDDFDWIQLNTGEWLKGRIKAMQERKLEFDSEKLELLTFDWKDIQQIRSPRMNDLWLANGMKVSGPIRMSRDVVSVGGDVPQTFDRDQIESITPVGKRELDFWSGRVMLGLTLRAGNTKEIDYTADVWLKRRTPDSRLSLAYLGNYSRTNDVESSSDSRVTTEYDRWLTKRLYLVVPFIEYYHDPFQNLAHRVTGGVGAGYDLIDRRGMEWTVMAGPAYQRNWFDSVPPGSSDESDSAAVFFGTRFDWELTSRIDIVMEYRGQYSRPDLGATSHHAVASLEVEMTKHIDLDLSLIWDRIDNPKVEADGVRPRQDDLRLVLGVGVKF